MLVKICPTSNRGKPLFMVTWFVAGKRRRRNFAGEAAARKEAALVATKLNAGEKQVLMLTSGDRESHLDAKRLLAHWVYRSWMPSAITRQAARVRASNTPHSRPLINVPSSLPRCSTGASSVPSGIKICGLKSECRGLRACERRRAPASEASPSAIPVPSSRSASRRWSTRSRFPGVPPTCLVECPGRGCGRIEAYATDRRERGSSGRRRHEWPEDKKNQGNDIGTKLHGGMRSTGLGPARVPIVAWSRVRRPGITRCRLDTIGARS